MKVDANMELDVSELYRYTSCTDIHHVLKIRTNRCYSCT